MENSALITLLQTFTSKDFRDARKFINSPFHNQRKDVVILFNYLAKAIKNSKPSLGRETIFKLLYPNKSYSDQRLRYVMSYLMQVLKSYITWKHLAQKEHLMQQNLCEAFQSRGLDDLFEKEWAKAFRMLEEELPSNSSTKQLGYHKENFLNLIRIVRQMLQISPNDKEKSRIERAY